MLHHARIDTQSAEVYKYTHNYNTKKHTKLTKKN